MALIRSGARTLSPRLVGPVLLTLLALLLLVTPFSASAADEPPAGPSPTEVKKKLLQAIQSGDDAALVQVLRKAGSIPGRQMTNMLLATARKLPGDFEDSYWLILDGVAGFQHGGAFTEMGEYITRNKREPISRDLMNALRKSESKYLGRVIRRILERGTLDMQMMAVDLAPNAKVRRTVDILMPYLEQEYAKENDGRNPPTLLKKRLIMALEALTLQRFGDGVLNWVGWWNINREKGLRVLRHEAENDDSMTSVGPALDPVRAREMIGLEEMEPGTVLVIKGPISKRGTDINYDHIEHVLESLRIQHDVVEKGRVEESDFRLDAYEAIFINCTQINEFCQNPEHTPGEYTGDRLHRCVGPGPHDPMTYKMKQPALDKLKKWVERGGYLFTEDWALVEVIEPLWDSFLVSGSPLDDSNVHIRPSRGFTAHPFLRGVFVPPPEIDWGYDDELDEDDIEEELAEYDPSIEDDAGDFDESRGKTGLETPPEEEIVEIPDPDIDLIRHEWKIDKESPSLSIRSKKVEVLVVSPDLKAQVGDDAVAVTFPVKKGRVLHVLSHFGKQSSSHNEATLENLLINFLIEVNVRAGS
ncbi:MAG: hypothetical protein ACYTGJ_02785 [Planctomycetota bacterium]|jgi:hypothetical protein